MADSAKKKKDLRVAPTLSVKLISTENGGRAVLMRGWAAEKARPLAEFSAAVQERLKGAAKGTVVFCAAIELVDVEKLQPIDPPAPKPAAAPSRQYGNQGTPRQASQPVTVPGGPSLFDDNPYNFAEWEGDATWLPSAEEVDASTHERWRESRHSGVLHVTFTAHTPIFVPEGRVRIRAAGDEPDRTPQHFWRCHDADGVSRYAIPGSTVKGVVRTLFETLTNSRLGIASEDSFSMPIPYRRRSSTLYVVEGPDTEGNDLRLRLCEVEFTLSRGGSLFHRVAARRPDDCQPWTPVGSVVKPINGRVDPGNTTDWQVVPYNANLLAVDPSDQRHGWKLLYVRVTPETIKVSADDRRRYEKGIDHSTYTDTLGHSLANEKSGLAKNFYRDATAEKARLDRSRARLKSLARGDLVFGIPDPKRQGYLACFGKNVNFLWPSQHSPQDLAHGFYPRAERSMSLAGADRTDLVFGFAGADSGDSHPFRGRVRFTTFWADGEPQPMGQVELGPLTSPSGTKLKARSLYLPPGGTGGTQTYDEASRLRGRKFYWHQHAADNGVAGAHQRQTGQSEGQLPAPIHPLPRGTVFRGQIVFDDLTDVELGALVASVCPGRLFGDGASKYGVKIGKGKPRGLGSVEVALACAARGPVEDRYRRLAMSPAIEVDPSGTALEAYKTWLASHGSPWEQVRFVQDLRNLLRMPDIVTIKAYRTDPKDYGWLPDFYVPRPANDNRARAAIGDPTGQTDPGKHRPRAMKPARGEL